MKFIHSLSGFFYCNTSGFQYVSGDDLRYAVYSESRGGRVMAWIRTDGVIIGAESNSGDSLFDRLSPTEKADVATLIPRLW